MTPALDAAGAPGAAKEAQDLFGVPQLVAQAHAVYAAGVVVGHYYVAQNSQLVADNASQGNALSLLSLAASDSAVAGRIARFRVRLIVVTNAAAPTSTIAGGLYPVGAAVAGGAGAVGVDLTQASVLGQATVTAPTATTVVPPAVGAEFALPADGVYTLGVQTTVATAAANSFTHLSLFLERRYV
jgi:hypothetical protein